MTTTFVADDVQRQWNNFYFGVTQKTTKAERRFRRLLKKIAHKNGGELKAKS